MLNSNFATEIHYTIAEIAKIWHMSPNKVCCLFVDELGVVRFGREESRFKRANVHLRIPASVMQRVHNRLSVQ